MTAAVFLLKFRWQNNVVSGNHRAINESARISSKGDKSFESAIEQNNYNYDYITWYCYLGKGYNYWQKNEKEQPGGTESMQS